MSETNDDSPQSLPRPRTILLAEDERMVRALMMRVLKDGGFHVIEAEDGMQAIQIYRELAEGIDMAVLDVIMPKVGGRQVFEAIRARQPRVPILFSSGYQNELCMSADEEDEITQFLAKPYTPDELTVKVLTMLAAAGSGCDADTAI